MSNPVPSDISNYMAELGRKGGNAITPAKAKERARKGGEGRAKKNKLGQYAKKPRSV